MNRKHSYSIVYSITGLIIVLGIALGFDFLMTYLTQHNAVLDSPFFILWLHILIALFLAAAILLLFWYVLNRSGRNIGVALIFLIIGLFIATYPILYFTPAFGGLFYRLPQLNNILLSFQSYTFFSGSLIAGMGLFILVLPKGKG